MAHKKTDPKTSVVRVSAGVTASKPIAGFDFDSTLAPCKNRGPNVDFSLILLKHLAKSHNIVIFSNCGTTKRGADSIKDFAKKSKCVINYYVSMKHDRFRKPHTGMWELFLEDNPGYDFKKYKASSFYCGDAAGRPGDFSASDYAFAYHVGLQFFVAEKLYMSAVPSATPNLNAKYDEDTLVLLSKKGKTHRIKKFMKCLSTDEKHTILLMGSPGSGKSKIAKEFGEHGASVISRENQSNAIIVSLLKGNNANIVLVDGTHRDKASRKQVLDIAREKKTMTHIIHVSTPKQMCFHLNAARCQLENVDEIPAIALHTYWKKLEPPDKKEADTITTFDFQLEKECPEIVRFRYL